jgi:hypothetical protein
MLYALLSPKQVTCPTHLILIMQLSNLCHFLLGPNISLSALF